MNHARPPEEISLNSWVEFELELQKIRAAVQTEPGYPRFGTTLSRRHANSQWRLETTLDRAHPDKRSLSSYYGKASAVRPHVETLSGKRWDKLPTFWEFKEHLKNFAWLDDILSNEAEVYEYLVYLRHHGFPSPLLDWTSSPYVAAFFAFDDVDKKAEKVSICAALRGPFSSGSNSLHCYFVGPYMRTDQRHALQQSQYSMCVAHDTQEGFVFQHHEEGIWGAVGPEWKVVKITIPAAERRTALEHLDSMNINPFSLFGTEDSLVRTIARRELEFKDWNL